MTHNIQRFSSLPPGYEQEQCNICLNLLSKSHRESEENVPAAKADSLAAIALPKQIYSAPKTWLGHVCESTSEGKELFHLFHDFCLINYQISSRSSASPQDSCPTCRNPFDLANFARQQKPVEPQIPTKVNLSEVLQKTTLIKDACQKGNLEGLRLLIETHKYNDRFCLGTALEAASSAKPFSMEILQFLVTFQDQISRLNQENSLKIAMRRPNSTLFAFLLENLSHVSTETKLQLHEELKKKVAGNEQSSSVKCLQVMTQHLAPLLEQQAAEGKPAAQA